jgi:hypothetical protein
MRAVIAAFIGQLNKAIEGAPFTLIAAVIDKIAHKKNRRSLAILMR